VVDLTSQLNVIANDLEQTEIVNKKMEFLKTEIKEKLREYAQHIDEVYKILDKKIVTLAIDANIENKHKNNSKGSSANASLRGMQATDKESQRTHEKSNPSYETDRFFTDTLNPRVLQLEEKIAQHEHNEKVLNAKISELKDKN
jgi:hypothetical protein